MVKRLLNIIGLPQIFHWALTMLCHQKISKQSRILWPLENIFKFFLVSVFSLELFIYRRTSRDFVLGPDSNAHDEREERGYFSISGFWFKSDYSEKWLMMTLSVSTIKPIPLWASFFPGKESGGEKKISETGKEFGWCARMNSQAKVIKLIYNSFQTLMFHGVIFHLLSGTVTAPEIQLLHIFIM